MAESKEKLKSLLEKVKEEREKIALKLNIQIMRITASSPISSVQFSHSVVSNYLQCHGLQNARLPCPSPTPGACSNSCSLSQWCHLTISSSIAPFSFCPQAFPQAAFLKLQHQGLFQWVGSLHQVARVLESHLQHQSFQWILIGKIPINYLCDFL